MTDYTDIIKQYFHKSQNINITNINTKTPTKIKTDNINGTITVYHNPNPKPVYEVQTPDKTYIYKPSDSESSYISYRLSQLFLNNNCPVPKTHILYYNNAYFEYYEKLHGKTLAQAMLEGMSELQILHVLHQVLWYDYKISQTNFDDVTINTKLPLSYKHNQNNILLHGKLFARLYYPINKILCQHGKPSLHHCDLHPSNILLDNNNNVTALLDLGGISISDEYNMLHKIFLTWPDISPAQLASLFKSTFNYNINMKYFQFFIKLKQIRNKCRIK